MAVIEANSTGGKWKATTAWTGGVVPGKGDDVVLGSGSGSIKVEGSNAECRSLEASAYTKTLTLKEKLIVGTTTGNAGLAFKLGTGMKLAIASSEGIEFVSTASEVLGIWSGGKELPEVIFNGAGGKWRLEEACSSESNIEVKGGELNTNGETVKCTKLKSAGSETRVIKLGASAVTLTGNPCIEVEGANLTFETGTSTITVTGANAEWYASEGVFYNVIIEKVTEFALHHNNTFHNLTLNIAGVATPMEIEDETTQTITGELKGNGKAGELVAIKSFDAAKKHKFKKTTGTVSVDYFKLTDSKAEGGASFYAGTHSENVTENEGWKFEAPPSGAEETLTVSQAQGATLLAKVSKGLTLTQAQTVVGTKTPVRALSSTQAQSVALLATPARLLSVGQGQVVKVVKVVARLFGLSQAQTSSITSTPSYPRELKATQVQIAAETATPSLGLSATQSQEATETATPAHARKLEVRQAQEAGIEGQIGKTLSTTQSQEAGLRHPPIGKILSAVQAQLATIAKLIRGKLRRQQIFVEIDQAPPASVSVVTQKASVDISTELASVGVEQELP